MKKNRTVMTVFLVLMTVILLGTTIYISTLLSSSKPPTQIQKTKAAAITYTRKVDLFPTGITGDPTISTSPTITVSPSITPTVSSVPVVSPTKAAALLAQAPSIITTKAPAVIAPTSSPTKSAPTPPPSATAAPINTAPTAPLLSPTVQPLLAYNSTSISPTLIPVANTGGMANPTKKVQPTGVQQLPETGWIQMSSILFIVAASTILFSLLF